MERKIAIVCSGGDVAGMNPALRYFVEYSLKNNLEPYFIYDGFEGLIDNKIKKASIFDVEDIINRGGTIIKSSRSKRFFDAKYRAIAKDNLEKIGIDMLIVLGGDGSFRGMEVFYKEHNIKFAGIPSTIDNDIAGTNYCLGVDSALNIIKDAVDAIRDTAESFNRALVIETMGKECGYLALTSALTSDADLCLIPEVEYQLSDFEESLKQKYKNGKKYFIAIIAEGIKESANDIAKWFEDKINIESRVSILGYIQRGGIPTSFDRLMAYKFIKYAIDGLLNGKNDSIICFGNSGFEYKSIYEVANQKYSLDKSLLEAFSYHTKG